MGGVCYLLCKNRERKKVFMSAFATVCIKKLGKEAQGTNYAGDRGDGTLEMGWGIRARRKIFLLYLFTDTYLCIYVCVCMCVYRNKTLPVQKPRS